MSVTDFFFCLRPQGRTVMKNWAYLASELTQKFPSITDIQVRCSGAAKESLKYSKRFSAHKFNSVEECTC